VARSGTGGVNWQSVDHWIGRIADAVAGGPAVFGQPPVARSPLPQPERGAAGWDRVATNCSTGRTRWSSSSQARQVECDLQISCSCVRQDRTQAVDEFQGVSVVRVGIVATEM
jgi:hypothetical protein